MADGTPDSTPGSTSGSAPDVRAVFWDLGGVLLDVESVRAGHRRFAAWLVDERGLDAEVEDALDAWRTAVGDYFRARDDTAFRPAREAYARGVEAVVGDRLPDEAWRPGFRETVESGLRPVGGARAAVGRIAETDRHQGVISDVDDAEGRRILRQLGFAPYLDSVTTSEAVGRTKPDPQVFEAALAAAGVSAERAMMVGDRYEHDVAGAARAGMVAVAFGAADGPAVDHRIEDPRDVLGLLGIGE